MVSLLVILGVILVQMLSGAVWWMAARSGPRISVYEAAGMGLALGTFASMLSSMLLASAPVAPLAWALPAAVTIVALRQLSRAGRLTRTRLRAPRAQSWAVLITLIAGSVAVAANWNRVPLDAPTTDSFADLYFFEAIARGLAEFGPAQSILMDGGALRYHWFSYAWSGELTQISNAEPFLVLTRVLPLVALVGVSMLAISWAARLSRIRWVPLAAGLLIVGGGYAGALYGSILNFDSPSQSFTTMWLLALASAFLRIVQRMRLTPLLGICLALLSSAVTGGKVSHALVALGGMLVVTIALLITRERRARVACLATAIAAASMAVTYLLVLSGVSVSRNLTETVAVKASTWQGLDPIAGRLGVALGTIALLAAILARVAGMGWCRDRRGRVPDDWWFAAGGLLVGVAAVLLLSEGVNELWFILAASAPAAVLSAAGMGAAAASLHARCPRASLRRLALVLTPIPASLACLALSRNWPAHQHPLNWLAPISIWILVPLTALLIVSLAFRRRGVLRTSIVLIVCALPLTSILTRPATLWTSQRSITTEAGELTLADRGETASPGTIPEPAVVTAAETYARHREAAAWVDSHVPRDAVLATTQPSSALVPALTSRVMFIAGNRYQLGLGAKENYDTVWTRSDISESLATGPATSALAALCDSAVLWVWMEGAMPSSWRSAAELEFANDSVSIVRLLPRTCTQ